MKKYFFSFFIFFSFSNNNLIDSYSIKEISKRKSWPVILPITAALVTDYIMSKITSEKPSEEKTEKKSLDKKIIDNISEKLHDSMVDAYIAGVVSELLLNPKNAFLARNEKTISFLKKHEIISEVPDFSFEKAYIDTYLDALSICSIVKKLSANNFSKLKSVEKFLVKNRYLLSFSITALSISSYLFGTQVVKRSTDKIKKNIPYFIERPILGEIAALTVANIINNALIQPTIENIISEKVIPSLEENQETQKTQEISQARKDEGINFYKTVSNIIKLVDKGFISLTKNIHRLITYGE